MKTLHLKTITSSALIILLFFTGLILFWNCNTNTAKTTSFELPNFLERSEGLYDSNEVSTLAQRFAKIKAKKELNSASPEDFLNAVDMYINEARITGEHPYYYPAALSTVDYVLKIKDLNKDDRFRALSSKATVLMSLHQFSTAEKVAMEAIQLNPYNSGIYGVLVDANVELGQYTKAVEYSDKMNSIRPDMRSYSRISYLREIHGDIDGSVSAMKMAINAGYPGYEATAWAGYTLGQVLLEYGNLDLAQEVFRGVLIERPSYAFAIAGLGSVEAAKGNYAAAEQFLIQAIEIMPEVSFKQELAMIYMETSKKAEAIKLGEELLIMMAEDEASGHVMSLEKAWVHLHLLNDVKNAKALVLEEYKVRPDNIQVNLRLAEILWSQKDYEKAEMHIQKAGITGSQNPDLQIIKGLMAVKKSGSVEDSVSLTQVLSAYPYHKSLLAKEARSVLNAG